MPDAPHLPHDAPLPEWAAAALRAPVAGDPAARARVMAAVRRAPRHRMRPRALAPRWARRGILAPGAGLALAATGVLALVRGAPLDAPVAAPHTAAVVLGDTVLGAALRDTLRLVRFVLAAPAGPAPTHVALAGAFNGWSASATPLARDARTGAWTVTVAVPRDAVRHVFVVDGARRVAAPRPAAPRPDASSDSV